MARNLYVGVLVILGAAAFLTGAGQTGKPPAPSTAVALAKKLLESAKCDKCNGKGEVTENVRTTEDKVIVPGLKQPVLTPKVVDCPLCKGKCISGDEKVSHDATAFHKRLAEIDIEDPKWENANEQLRSILDELAALGLDNWAFRINKKVATLFRNTPDPTGKSVLLVGELIYDFAINEGSIRVLDVEMKDAGVKVRFEKPRVIDAKIYDRVLCGGIVKHRDTESGQLLIVIENGFVVQGK